MATLSQRPHAPSSATPAGHPRTMLLSAALAHAAVTGAHRRTAVPTTARFKTASIPRDAKINTQHACNRVAIRRPVSPAETPVWPLRVRRIRRAYGTVQHLVRRFPFFGQPGVG